MLLLVCFVVYPIVLTAQLSTTNYGDGTRGTKEEAIAQIIGASVKQTADAPRYNLSVATTGSVTEGLFVFLLVDQETEEAYVGDAEGLEPFPDATVTDGFVTEALGYTLLTPVQVNDGSRPSPTSWSRPTAAPSVSSASVRPSRARPPWSTTRRPTRSPTPRPARSTPRSSRATGSTRGRPGERVADQSWQANVGLDNYKRIFTDDRISSDFLRIFLWTLVFAFLSVATTFLLGLGLAATLSDPRVRGRRLPRDPGPPVRHPRFHPLLLLWSSFFNRDFGLINTTLGLDIQWFGDPTMAKVAVLITNLWMGFLYMFLVCTGALTSIPDDLKEAASIDGASGFAGFRRVTFPLLLVAVAPLLVSSFAFNFNNFNAIYLLTEGGPFTPEPRRRHRHPDQLHPPASCSAPGAQIGFASAVSVVLFVLTGVIAAIQFRATRALEDVN